MTGFYWTNSNLSEFAALGETVLWGFDEDQRDLLLEWTQEIPELRAIVARGRPHEEIDGLLIVDATVEELDQMYTLVEDLTDVVRSQKKRDLLDELRASLCTSMDGF